MEVRRRRQPRADALLALCQGHVPQGSSAEHSFVEQGPGGDPEAGARGRAPLPNADREPAAQVRIRAPQRDLKSVGRRPDGAPIPLDVCRASCRNGQKNDSFKKFEDQLVLGANCWKLQTVSLWKSRD